MMGHGLINLARVHEQVLGVGAAMADLELNSSGEYSGSSAGETNSCVVGNSVWGEWTHADEVSTSGFLPELTTMSSSSSRLAFHPTDMLSSWMSTLHPLALAPPTTTTTTPEPTFDIDPHPALFMHEALDHHHPHRVSTSLVADPTYGPRVGAHPTLPPYPPADASPLPAAVSGMNSPKASTALQAIDPPSPSSPLAIQNGMLNPLGDPWDGASRPWPGSTPSYSPSGLSRPRHTDIFIGPNGTFESTPGGWTPQFYDGMATETIKPVKMMEGTSTDLQSHPTAHAETHALGRPGDPTAWLGKHRLELSLDGDDHPGALQLKRSKPSVTGNGLTWGHDLRGSEVVMTYNGPSAMDMIALGPALNTNGKPRARRGSATDPQSVYARQRRERINDRLKTLQHLVPNGAKVDIVTMLDEAYDYVKFLQYQVTLLKSDEFWMHATPYSYNGMDISNVPALQAQELESSA